MASQAITCVKTVKSFANEDLEAAKYDEKLSDLYLNAKKDIILKPMLQTIERVGTFYICLLYKEADTLNNQ